MRRAHRVLDGAAPDLATILDEIATDVGPSVGQGRAAQQVPALAKRPTDRFGIAIQTVAGERHSAGDSAESFSIQSISKLFTLTLALQLEGEALWSRIGRRPTDGSFNSLAVLEQYGGKPVNPFVNAGALVLVDVIMGHLPDADEQVLELVRSLSGNSAIDYDIELARSERELSHRNTALAHLLVDNGRLHRGVEEVLESYFLYCSIEMSCADLAQACQYLAQGGRNPLTEEAILTSSLSKRTNAVLLTSGVYADAGDFAYRVGIPAKSGIGGGIAAIMPGAWCAAVWSPALNESGNSIAGTHALELLTTKTGSSVF